MIYLDNAATTNYKPQSVKNAVLKALSKNFCANPGRSSHDISIRAAMQIFKTRELLSELFHLNNSNNVIFTSGCTEALNLAIFGSAKQKGHVITTIYEHNSVLRPLFQLKERGVITLTIVKPNENGEITVKELQDALQPNTYLLAVNHCSNVTGYTMDLYSFGKFCKEHSLLFLVDGAQSGGHKKIDIQENHINLLTLAGHKGFYAPQGVGALLINDVTLTPLKFGGTGIQSELPLPPTISPEAFEAGTTCTPNIFGFYEGILFSQKYFNKIEETITTLTKYLLEELKKIKGITIYTRPTDYNGVISFNLYDIPSQEIANELNTTNQICVRSRLHCAPLVHEYFGTLAQGMIRVSLSVDNKIEEINTLLMVLQIMSEKYRSK